MFFKYYNLHGAVYPPIRTHVLVTRLTFSLQVQTGMPPPGLVDMNHTIDNLEYSRYHRWVLCWVRIMSQGLRNFGPFGSSDQT